MADITLDDLAVRWPQFSGVDPDQAQAAIDDAYLELRVAADGWGDRLNRAAMLLAAHYLTINEATASEASGAPTGAIKTEKVGDVSVTYGDAGSSAFTGKDGILSTVFGTQFEALRMNTFAGQSIWCL